MLRWLYKGKPIQDLEEILTIVDSLDDLTARDKKIIRVRFTRISSYINRNFKNISWYYNWSKLFMLSAGVVNPALLSIERGDQSNTLFWTVWGLQLSVSLLTGVMSFLKWDKKYYLFHQYRTKIIQEIWLYIELTGPYATNVVPNEEERQLLINHKTKLNDFLTRIEVIYRKLKDASLEIESQTDDDTGRKQITTRVMSDTASVEGEPRRSSSGAHPFNDEDMNGFKFRSRRNEPELFGRQQVDKEELLSETVLDGLKDIELMGEEKGAILAEMKTVEKTFAEKNQTMTQKEQTKWLKRIEILHQSVQQIENTIQQRMNYLKQQILPSQYNQIAHPFPLAYSILSLDAPV